MLPFVPNSEWHLLQQSWINFPFCLSFLKTYSKRNWKKCGHFRTISGHFFANNMSIFHKTEVQTVILRCLTGLNCNWFKSYGLRCSRRLQASSVNFWKMSSDKWPLYDHIWPFFRNYMIIFDKTEIQTVSLRCLTSLYLNWNKSYDTKPKNSKNASLCFCTKSHKNGNGNICIFLHLRP